ncbi:MAG TPA: hypothetical protein VFT70_17670 [Nocardioides sp.]|nr:hypothetical protein [Nocardioides sp.]
MRTIDDCASAAMAALGAEVLGRFPADPLHTMRVDLGLKVQEAEHLTEKRADGGACDGLSFLKDGVVLYAPTRNSRRENFTLAHELGHWLVNQVPGIFDWLVDQPNPKKMLETLCDRIAQRLLLGDGAMGAVIGAGPIQASHVLKLYETSQASLPACAIALAARLPGVGAVILVDRDEPDGDPVVRYASVRPDLERGWPKVYPWPGQTVPPAHPLRFITEGAPVRRRSWWSTPWGEREVFYIDAIAINARRTIAILADTDLWGAEAFHPPTNRSYDERPEQEIACCGQIRVARGYPCNECGQVHCPACKKCRCDKQNDELVLCKGSCFLKYRKNLLVDGKCEDCR